jgi:hypothetical protein
MPLDLSVILIIATVLATILLGLGAYRMYGRAKRAEPKVLGALALETLHLMELDSIAKHAAADAALAEAKNADQVLAQIRAKIAGSAATAA